MARLPQMAPTRRWALDRGLGLVGSLAVVSGAILLPSCGVRLRSQSGSGARDDGSPEPSGPFFLYGSARGDVQEFAVTRRHGFRSRGWDQINYLRAFAGQP
jgi:hypothetical protein